MYRFLKFRNLPSYNPRFVSSNGIVELGTKICGLCNHRFVARSRTELELVRSQSTSMRTAVQNNLTKKKKKRTKKKYAELLEVTEDSSSQKKASVSNLTSEHISLFAKEPGISLSQLYCLKHAKSHGIKGNISDTHHKQGAILFVPKNMCLDSIKTDAISRSLNETLPKGRSSFTSSLVDDFNDGGLNNLNGQVIEDVSEMVSKDDMNLLQEEHMINDKTLVFEDSGIVHEWELSNNPELRAKVVEDLNSLAKKNAFKDIDSALQFQECESFDENVDETSSITPFLDTVRKEKKVAGSKLSLNQVNREKLAKVKYKDLEQAGRDESFLRNLSAYLDICVHSGMLNRSLATFNHFRIRSKHSKDSRHLDITLYNILLRGFASKGDWNKVQDILQYIKVDKIKPSLETYQASLECLSHLPNVKENNNHIQEILRDMKQNGWNCYDILEKCRFVGNQRQLVVSAIQRVQRDFIYTPAPPERCYSCSLLKNLNISPEKEYNSPMKGVMTTDDLKKAAKEQFDLENQAFLQVKSIASKTETNLIKRNRKKLEETQEKWKQSILTAFKRNLAAIENQNKHYITARQINVYPFLKVLPEEDYVELIMQEIRRLAEGSETFSPTKTVLYMELGSQVQAKYEVYYKNKVGVIDKLQKVYEDYCKWYCNPSGYASNTRESWLQLVYKNMNGADLNIGDKQWPYVIIYAIGKFLYTIILKDIKINVYINKVNSDVEHLLPAFYSLFRYHGRLLKEEIKPHPALTKLFHGASLDTLAFNITTVPMLSPPLPWSSVSDGGYLIAKTDFIRLPSRAVQQRHRLKQVPENHLYPAFDSLNQLSAVPWIVNQPILDIVLEVFNSGGSSRLEIPEPSSACPSPPSLTPEMTKKERFDVYRQRLVIRRRRGEMHSLWCDALYRLSLANHFRNKIFWLPHNMDFRGRVYPCPPHLNHLGSDMARSLLKFARGEKLGEHGLDWLKVHLVNLTGFKKRDPIAERLSYANEMMPEILDSADNPLTGHMWWTKGDEQWQILACCMEIANAIRSGNPEEYMCQFPVHQDGSCNGLQHYAALGRDSAGAESVNLSPSYKPQDVYSCVAALVEEERKKDAKNGVQIAQILDGHIQRKVIKQTVMTTVYGVTRYGARLQIVKQLKEIDNFPKDAIWAGSTYLVGKTFECLREMFTSAKEIQDWFTECARLISQVCGENVEWVTPLGLPIVQHYCRSYKLPNTKDSRIKGHYTMDMFERPNTMKQKNAFPPNFIHSLDSSHMMLTSLFCEREGITFVSVHDCYWTHPSMVQSMSKICREQFVSLHSQPILEDLSRFLVCRYGYRVNQKEEDSSSLGKAKFQFNDVLRHTPSKGNFDLQRVLESVYFFS